ncbi:hypothetical protein HAT2_00525 [Candidatus Similichlamydia laticola]|uniref:Apolipoprotein N-acyltransferase N-terminal domain-containing protein n=1 Tax=Candidatus Similichlamydia laticola TaxID=2170265 RepID=A0A369KD36_9BACT|nr:hypothetical protein HAT2_00525 [Candidatus Similichlamydia laticola]
MRFLLSFFCIALSFPPYFCSWIGLLALLGWTLFFFDWNALLYSSRRAVFWGWIWSLGIHFFWLRGVLHCDIGRVSSLLLWFGASFFYSLQFGCFLKVLLILKKRRSSLCCWTVASWWTFLEGIRLWIFDGVPLAFVGLSIASCSSFRQLTCLGGPLFLSHWTIWLSLSCAFSLLERRLRPSFILALLCLFVSRWGAFSPSRRESINLLIANTHFVPETCSHSVEEIWVDWLTSLLKSQGRSLLIFPENTWNSDIELPICLDQTNGLFLCSQKELLKEITKQCPYSILIGVVDGETAFSQPKGYLFSDGRLLDTFEKRYLIPGYEKPCFLKDNIGPSHRTFSFECCRAGVLFCWEALLPWPYEECLAEDADFFLVLSNYAVSRNSSCFFAYPFQLLQLYAQGFGLPIVYVTNCGVSGLSDSDGTILFCQPSPVTKGCHACDFLKVTLPVSYKTTVFSYLKTKGLLLSLVVGIFISTCFSQTNRKRRT